MWIKYFSWGRIRPLLPGWLTAQKIQQKENLNILKESFDTIPMSVTYDISYLNVIKRQTSKEWWN